MYRFADRTHDLFGLESSSALQSDFSVQSLCSLYLCGVFFEQFIDHRDTEDTEVSQRNLIAKRLNFQVQTNRVSDQQVDIAHEPPF